MSDVTNVGADAPAADSPVTTPAAGNASEPVITREQSNSERMAADENELDGELQKVLDKAKTGNERAEKGKFTPKALPAGQIQGDADKAVKADATDKAADADKPAAPAVRPPQSWTADMKEKFSAYSPEEQQFFAKREAEAHRAISQLGQQVKAVKPVTDTLERYRPSFERNGVTFEQGIENLVKASDMLDQNPHEAIRHLAAQYKVDLFDLIEATPQGRSDPALSALQNQVSALQRELQEARSERENRTRGEQTQKLQTFERMIEDFAKDKADFNDLEADILGSIEAIREAEPHLQPQEILQTAYERAQWANPRTRQGLIEKTEKERIEKARKEADAAKRASSINVRGAHQAVTDDDLDSELHGVLRKHRA